jgi:hypothetical protein
MGLLFAGLMVFGKVIFATSLVLMVGSLAISLIEIRMSVGALNLQLCNMEQEPPRDDAPRAASGITHPN